MGTFHSTSIPKMLEPMLAKIFMEEYAKAVGMDKDIFVEAEQDPEIILIPIDKIREVCG